MRNTPDERWSRITSRVAEIDDEREVAAAVLLDFIVLQKILRADGHTNARQRERSR